MKFATLRRRLRQTAWVLLGLFVSVFLAATAMRVYVGHEYARCLRVVQDAGIPITVAELNAQYVVQCPSMEAFELYERAFAVMGDSSVLDELVSMNDESVFGLSPVGLQTLHAFVEANAEAIAILGKATRLPCARFPLEQLEWSISPDFDRDVDKQVPARSREAIRILRFAALESLARGDHNGAVEHVVSLIGISRHLLDAPVLEGGFIAAFSIAVVNGVVETGMRHSQWNEPEIESIAQGLIGVEEALISARNETGQFAVYRHLLSPAMNSLEFGGGMFAHILGMEDDDITAVVILLPWVVSGIGMVASYARLHDLYSLEILNAEAACLDVPSNLPFSATEQEGISVMKYRSLAMMRLLLAACAVEFHRLRYVDCPDALTALDEVQRTWVKDDPYTGTPMQYRRDGQEFILYCVGRDLVDDGGHCEDCDGCAWGKDVVLEIFR